MSVRVLLRDGTYLECKLFRSNTQQGQLVAKDEIASHLNKMNNKVFFKTKCIQGEFMAYEIRYWDVVGSEIDY